MPPCVLLAAQNVYIYMIYIYMGLISFSLSFQRFVKAYDSHCQELFVQPCGSEAFEHMGSLCSLCMILVGYS